MVAYLAAALILLALLLLWQAGRRQRSSGLPGGRVVFSDTNQWLAQEKPLYAPSLGLTGRPDYLVEAGQYIIPVEVKSARNLQQAPYDSHIYQLAAYCLLVAELYEQRPPYGLLHYTDGEHSRTYAIDFTPGLETSTRQVIADIQQQALKKGPARSHNQPARCAACGFRTACDQALQ